MNIRYTENILEAPLGETVCWCSAVSKQAILDAVQGGARTMEDIRRMTGACTLGRCKELSPRGRCCSKEIMLLLVAETRCRDHNKGEGIMKIEILGTGCAKCKTLYENVKQAVEAIGMDAEIVKVEDIPSIMKYGVMSTPALVIDGKVLFSGKVASVGKIKGVL